MALQKGKEEEMRGEFFAFAKLSKTNQRLADEYLDTDNQESPELLERVEPEDFMNRIYVGDNKYLQWLRRERRTEELGRYVRFVVTAGGSTAWNVLVSDRYSVGMKELGRILVFHTGEKAEEQRMAVMAGLAVQVIMRGHSEDVKVLCQSGKEKPEIFRKAMNFCRDCDGYFSTGRSSNARLLLAAMYLHHMPADVKPEMQKVAARSVNVNSEEKIVFAGETNAEARTGMASDGLEDTETAKEIIKFLEEGLIASIRNIAAFEKGELKDIQEFARNAEQNTPFPQRILSIYRGRAGKINPTLPAVCAFLAIRHSYRLEILLRLMVAVEFWFNGKNTALDACRGITEEKWFDARMEEIEEMLPIQDDTYVLWGLHAGCRSVIERMAMKCPEGIKAAVAMASSDGYTKLIEMIKDVNSDLHGELRAVYEETLRRKIVYEILQRLYVGREAARDYFLGEKTVDILEPYMGEWVYDSFGDYEQDRCRRIEHLKELGELQMYRRAVVLEVLRKDIGFFTLYSFCNGQVGAVSDGTGDSLLYRREQIDGILQLLEEEGLSVRMQAEAVGGILDSISDKKKKTALSELCVEVFAQRQQGQDQEQWKNDMESAVAEGNTTVCCFCLSVLEKVGSGQYRDIILSCANIGAKQVRELLLSICREHREWKQEVLALLASKKVKEREFSILVMEEWGDTSCLEAVRAALEREKNKKLLTLLQELTKELEAEQRAGQGTGQGTERAMVASGSWKRKEEKLAAEIYRGIRKRKVEWVQGITLPKVHDRNGEEVSPEYMLAILAVYADMELPGIHPDAVQLAAILEAGEVSLYMQSLYGEWILMGAEAKKRWVLYAVSIHGSAAMISVFYQQIKEWSEHSRGAMAAEAVKALALNSSSEALLLVDQMSRKFKFRQVKNAAGEALATAADTLGISREELEDRLVPNLGLNEQRERVFDYGSRSFTVRLNLALEVEVYDGSGKRLKSLPSPGKQDDPDKAELAADEFKQMKKQLKTVIQNQKLRLEQALSMARFWKIQDWQELFVKNPIMHQFAVGLIWGIYENGTLKETFRYMEDGSFNTVDESEYTLPERLGTDDATGSAILDPVGLTERVIGLVHPLELLDEELAAWKEQLTDYEIAQPFEQLNRTIYRIEETEAENSVFTQFSGRMINGLSLSGKLLNMGWFRGEILDAGFYENYYRRDGNVGAELTFSGSSVGYENGDVTVYNVYFYRFADHISDGGTYSVFSKENRCKLKEAGPRYFSEVVWQVARVLGEFVKN